MSTIINSKANETYPLWEERQIPFFNQAALNDENRDGATITSYLLEDGKAHGAVLVFPGGGYVKRVVHKEGEPIAKFINSLGLHAFVVNYRVHPYPPEISVIDGKRAVKYIRHHAGKFGVIKDKIGLIGFSAGGSVACHVTEFHDVADYAPFDAIDQESARPDCGAFCYAPLSFKEDNIASTDYNRMREMIPDERVLRQYLEKYSCDNNIREDMPPLFLWHTVDDERVPVTATIDFIKQLKQKNQSFECHLFPEGGHGAGIEASRMVPGMSEWPKLYHKWLERIGMLNGE
ncbi:alpha/beta hydrolase [Paenibacillus sp. M1]|uniref:Alpha/beta hydrolase n=1 Tax=Paenibacillus haidiansis TaxID=1574488 RepID=A0ABU7VWV8_9BACL